MKQIAFFNIPKDKSDQFIEFANVFKHDPYTQPELLARTMGGKLAEIFPPDLLDAFNQLTHSQLQAIIIKGMPIDKDIPRGLNADKDVKKRVQYKTRVSENTILGTASLMGFRLDSNPKEQEGRIVHNVHVVAEKEGMGPSGQSSDPFYLHIENPFDQKPPQYLMLLALEGDPKAKTTLFLIDHLLEELPNWVIDSMKKPEFEIRSGSGFDKQEIGVFPLIAYEEDTHRYCLRLYQITERIRPITDEAKTALDFVRQKFNKVLTEKPETMMAISLNPGEAIIFNNCYGLEKIAGMMHGRQGVIENKTRWLQRAYFYQQTDEWKTKYAQGSFQLVSEVIDKKDQYNLRHVAATLAATMLTSKDCREYKKLHPEATDKQVLLYGTEGIRQSKNSWLQRVATEHQDFSPSVPKGTSSNKI